MRLLAVAHLLVGIILFAFSYYFANIYILFIICAFGCISSICTAYFITQSTWTFLIGKTKQGRIPWWSYLLYWPYHFCAIFYCHFLNRFITMIRGETDVTQVYPGWYLGGVYSKKGLKSEKIVAVLDLTTEFNRIDLDIAEENYLNVPVWDGCPPTLEQLDKCVEFLKSKHREGPILVHCAYGRGRSTCMLVAGMTACGIFKNWREAFEHVKKKRPYVNLNRMMQTQLDMWSKRR